MIPYAATSSTPRLPIYRAGIVVALTLLALVPIPQRAAFAHDAPLATASVEGRQASEGDVDLEGTLEIIHEDRDDGGRYLHFLTTNDERRFEVHGAQDRQDLLTGDRVQAKGARIGKNISLSAGTAALSALTEASLSNTFGVQKTVVLLVNFANDPSQPYTLAQARARYAEVDAFFRETSYQQASLDIDIFGWYTLPMNSTPCDGTPIRTYARQAAAAAGVNLAQYQRHIFAFPFISSCGWGGGASIGGNPSSAWINGDRTAALIAHEVGHTFGLYHSHALQCGAAGLGASCTAVEYGDFADAMGVAGHFNAFQKQRLGWLDFGNSPPITAVQGSGTYTIDAYELPGTGPKALKIPRGATGQSLFVEFRQNIGWDGHLPRSGVLIRLASDSDANSSQLLDANPQTPSFYDAFLDPGKSFQDPYSPVRITTISTSSTSATILVTTSASCVRANPTLTASPNNPPAVPAGTPVTYSVSVTNTDSPACAASSFTLQATAPSSWPWSFAVPSLTVNPGATGSTTLTVTSPAMPPAAYIITGTATHASASSLSGSASVAYTVATSGGGSGGGTPGTFSDGFDRPDAPALGYGWSVVKGSMVIQSGEARNPANQTLNLVVQPGLTGATQTVAMSFSSTDNNTAPRFGVVVRYQDPLNYYICYRQLGGSSAARIARVRNGVETVLKSVGLSNPAAKAFSTLSCQASGSALTLQVGLTRVTTTDGTFPIGSVGFAVSSQRAGSHRADNFSAIVQ